MTDNALFHNSPVVVHIVPKTKQVSSQGTGYVCSLFPTNKTIKPARHCCNAAFHAHSKANAILRQLIICTSSGYKLISRREAGTGDGRHVTKSHQYSARAITYSGEDILILILIFLFRSVTASTRMIFIFSTRHRSHLCSILVVLSTPGNQEILAMVTFSVRI